MRCASAIASAINVWTGLLDDDVLVSAAWWLCERGVSVAGWGYPCCPHLIPMRMRCGGERIGIPLASWLACLAFVPMWGPIRGAWFFDSRGGNVEETGYVPSGVGLDFPWSVVS
jgi:hypothetical protein